MEIKSPLTNKNEVKPLCEAGADELFCGIEPYSWRKNYGNFSINQRSSGASFTKIADLEKAIQIAHSHKVKVHAAVNAFFYLEEQYGLVKEIIKDILNIGADGIIFAEPAVIFNTEKNLLKGKDVVVGCDAVILNSSAVSLYKKLGATRVVLPRSMTMQEIGQLIKRSSDPMEYEAFIIHDLCFFEDGFCTFCKEATGGVKKEGRRRSKVSFFSSSRTPYRGFGGGCRTGFKKQKLSLRNNRQIGKIKPFQFWMKKHIEGCGACAIYDFKNIGVTNLKVLDRNLPMEEKVKATRLIRQCLDLLSNGRLSKNDYIEHCKKHFKEEFKVKCSKFDCYYP